LGETTIFETIDMNLIENVVSEQKRLKKMNMALPKEKRIPLRKMLFIYDDILGDDQLKSHKSVLSTFTCISRHSQITNIFLTQDYVQIPTTIRRQTPLVFLLNCDNYSEPMIKENALQGKEKAFSALYEKEIILRKDFSFLVVDKSAKEKDWLWKCTKGISISPLKIDGTSWKIMEETDEEYKE